MEHLQSLLVTLLLAILIASMIDVKNAKAGDNEHNEEGDHFKRYFSLLFWSQHFINQLFPWDVGLNWCNIFSHWSVDNLRLGCLLGI